MNKQINQPQWSAGYVKEHVNALTGEPSGYEIIETDTTSGMMVVSKRADRQDCQWTANVDWFSPPTSWQNCGGQGEWSSGSQKVELISGGLWPLRAGAKAVYRRKPVSSKGTVGAVVERHCEVFGPSPLKLSTEEYDTMKVVCNSISHGRKRETRTWYWTEEHGEVRYRHIQTEKGLVADSQLAILAP